MKTTIEDIMKMDTLELMEYLKTSISAIKYDNMDYDEYMELDMLVEMALEKLSNKSKLLAMPYKIALQKY